MSERNALIELHLVATTAAGHKTSKTDQSRRAWGGNCICGDSNFLLTVCGFTRESRDFDLPVAHGVGVNAVAVDTYRDMSSKL